MEYFKKESEFTPDKLFAGLAIPALMGFVEIESGQGILKRGTLIGKSSDDKFYIDASVYLSGIFNRSAVYLAEGADISDYEYECRKLSIYFENVME